MFCPLCQAEFRVGFRECGDCHMPLVPTELEARATPVGQLWKEKARAAIPPVLDDLDDDS